MLSTWVGKIQKASNRLTPSATVTTKGTTNMNLPRMPGSNISGKKAAMVVSTALVTGAATSSTPLITASRAGSPRCMR